MMPRRITASLTVTSVSLNQGSCTEARAGKSITIPFYGLSQADQDHVKDLLTSRGQETLIPPREVISPAPRRS